VSAKNFPYVHFIKRCHNKLFFEILMSPKDFPGEHNSSSEIVLHRQKYKQKYLGTHNNRKNYKYNRLSCSSCYFSELVFSNWSNNNYFCRLYMQMNHVSCISLWLSQNVQLKVHMQSK